MEDWQCGVGAARTGSVPAHAGHQLHLRSALAFATPVAAMGQRFDRIFVVLTIKVTKNS